MNDIAMWQQMFGGQPHLNDEAYDWITDQLKLAEGLLHEIYEGRLGLNQTLDKIDRYFLDRKRAIPGRVCLHPGGLVYEATCRIDGRQFNFSRCKCGHIFRWFEVT